MNPALLRIVVVRPYHSPIRTQVYAALEAAGVSLSRALEVAAKTPDRLALLQLSRMDADLLLLPFHAHRDSEGELVNGVELLPRIRLEVERHRMTPAICPVSRVGMAAAELLRSHATEDTLGPALFLPEDELDADSTRDAITRLLAGAMVGDPA